MRRAALGVALLMAIPARGAVEWEASEDVPTAPARSAWFPDLAVDSHGRAHAVWASTDHREMQAPSAPRPVRRTWEELAYAVRDANGWSAERRIAVPQRSIYRNALAIDAVDRLHLLFNYCPGTGYDIYYRQAPAAGGFQPGDWQRPRLVNFRFNSSMSDLVVVGDTVHMVFDDGGAADGECRYCADVYYRRSDDGGDTWTDPVVLLPTAKGSARPKIDIDAAGVLHVSWDEGWDRNSNRGKARDGVYLSSADGGATWSEPTIVRKPGPVAQLVGVGDGRGGVLLVWRTLSPKHPDIYYDWSRDWGATWNGAQAIPGIQAGDWRNPFDRYDLGVDRHGTFHLLAGGTVPQGATDLYHLEWDGSRWSAPVAIHRAPGLAEYPRLAFGPDDTVHALWYVRTHAFGEDVPHRLRYARGQIRPAADAAPAPAVPYARVSAPAPTPKPYPTPNAPDPQVVLREDWRRLRTLLACLAAGAAIVGAAQLLAAGWHRLRRRMRGTASP